MLVRFGEYRWDMPVKIGLLAVRSTEMLSYLAGITLVGFFVTQLVQAEVERRIGERELRVVRSRLDGLAGEQRAVEGDRAFDVGREQ